jgi:hypothetical protein
MSAARLLLACALAVLLSGCAEVLSLSSGAGPGGDGRVSLAPLLDPDSVAIPGTNAARVIEVLGEPDEMEKQDAPEPQRPGRAVTLRYDGLDVVVHELYQPSRNFIADMIVASRSYRTALGIRVGDSRGEIEEVLGEPLPPEDAQLSGDGDGSGDDSGSEASSEPAEPGNRSVYELTDQGDTITVTYDGDRAVELVYHYERG